MFIYKNWEKFCFELNELGIKTCTALEALSISSENRNFVIIKHDVETSVQKALAIANIEHQFNIQTTYYVQSYLLNSSDNLLMLKEIKDLGHEVTYHYDVLDSNKGDWKLAILEFNSTLLKFAKYGFDVKTVCPHGNPVMVRNGWSSNKDFFRCEEIKNIYPKISDIVINPEKFGANNFSYVSDAGYGWKIIADISNNDRKSLLKDEKIKNLDELIKLISKNEKSFIISAHPHRWRKYGIVVFFIKSSFFLLRFLVQKLTKIPLLHKFIGKFYFLAKKI